jgi:hypothetical protein
MDVKEFLAHFKDDLPVNTFDDYDQYLKWQRAFYKKTLPYHDTAKQSYFHEENRLVDNGYSHPDAGHLREFAYLGLFTNQDELEFSNLIGKVSGNLVKIDNEQDMDTALNYLYGMADFILHEIQHGDKLSDSFKDLKSKIIETKKLDTEGIGELVVRFIDLIV